VPEKNMKLMTVISGLILSLCLQPVTWSSEPQQQVSFTAVQTLSNVAPDVRIRYGNAKTQFIEGWYTTETKPLADIVFVHGGCWLSQYDISHSRALANSLRQHGYRVWSVEYRRVGDEQGHWPYSLDDIMAATELLIEEQQLNSKTTVLMGHSAGGHLALLAANKLNSSIAGVIGLAAITDIVQYARGKNSCQQATTQFMQGSPEEHPEMYLMANPIQQNMHTNTWLLYGGADHIVPATQATNVSGVHQVKTENAGHFDYIYPHSLAWNDVLKTIKNIL
jgi:acetyl esterase/lipase